MANNTKEFDQERQEYLSGKSNKSTPRPIKKEVSNNQPSARAINRDLGKLNRGYFYRSVFYRLKRLFFALLYPILIYLLFERGADLAIAEILERISNEPFIIK